MEDKNGERKSKKEKKVILLRVFATIVIIIAVLAILFLINFVRNLVIINDMIEMQSSFKDSTNYSYVLENYNSSNINDKLRIEHYYKDGKNIMVYSSNGNKITVWNDEETGETIYLDETQKQETETNSAFLLGNTLPYFQDAENKIYYAMTSIITNSNMDGKDCYRLQNNGSITYINKEDGIIVREVSGNVVVNGKEYDNITDFKDWKFNELTDEDMEKPDLK